MCSNCSGPSGQWWRPLAQKRTLHTGKIYGMLVHTKIQVTHICYAARKNALKPIVMYTASMYARHGRKSSRKKYIVASTFIGPFSFSTQFSRLACASYVRTKARLTGLCGWERGERARVRAYQASQYLGVALPLPGKIIIWFEYVSIAFGVHGGHPMELHTISCNCPCHRSNWLPSDKLLLTSLLWRPCGNAPRAAHEHATHQEGYCEQGEPSAARSGCCGRR